MDLDTYQPRVAAPLVEDFYPNGRKAGESRVIACPFCQQQHSHGSPLGSRVPHCTDYVVKRHQKVDPRDVQRTPGYVLCDPADAIDWDLERVMGQLIVLRNKHRRLTAEHADMTPWTARERGVKARLKDEIDGIAAMLRKAGVPL